MNKISIDRPFNMAFNKLLLLHGKRGLLKVNSMMNIHVLYLHLVCDDQLTPVEYG